MGNGSFPVEPGSLRVQLTPELPALRGADRIYRQLIETISEGAATLSADGVILYGNDRVAEMLGQPLDRVVGTALRDYLPPEDQGVLETVLALARTEPCRRDITVRTGQGGLVPICLSASSLRSEAAETVFCLVLTDLTVRTRAEAALRSTEKRFRALIEHGVDFISMLAVDGALLWENPSATRLLGYAPDAFLGRNIFELVHPDDAGQVRNALAQIVREPGNSQHGTFRLQRSDGSWRWVEARATNLLHDESVQAIVVNYRDVTEQKQAEEAREHREAELQESQRIAGVGSWEWTLASGVVSWSEGMNHVLARDLGLAAPAFEALASFYAPESWARLGGAIATAIETGASYELELEMIRADGTSCWTTTRGEAIRGADGTVVKLRGTVHDITERKRGEATLRLQGAALNAAANAIIITDASGTIEWTNAAFTSLTGYSAEEAIGLNPRDLIKSGVHDREFYTPMWAAILSGHVWHGEMTNRRKDGSVYPEEQTVTPVRNDRGEIAHFIAIKRDLTGQRQLETQFRQAQKMETVGRLAGGIAHDFNNLLTVINGTVDLMLTDLREGDPLRTDLEEIRHAGDRAAGLTRQLLAFSRKQIMKPQVLNLNSLVANLQSMFRRLIGEDITLVVTLGEDLGRVMADPSQVEQAIMNLVVNARDAMLDGGTLTIETWNAEADYASAAEHLSLPRGPHVMLAISDTGVGMDAAVRAKIFEPFFTTKDPGKGTGLGLSMVYGIVEQSGGSIVVRSEPGHGSVFTICLPRVEAAVDTIRLAANVMPGHGTETVLIVEDEEGVRHLAKRVLKSAGYNVLTAGSGEEALRVLERHDGTVDLVLTDVVMPGISGRELADRLAAIRPGTRVLYSSGYTDDAILRHGVLDPAIHFIGKPYTAAELTRLVRKALDS